MTEEIDTSTLTIEAWDIERPVDSDRNNKIHDKESLTRLAKSLDGVGQIQPLIVDREGVIIAGHGRRMAARSLGWKKIKVIQLPVDETTARKMRLADNLSSNQKYDYAAISSEMGDLSAEMNFEIDDSLKELQAIIGATDRMMDNVAPELTGALTMEEGELSTNVGEDVDAFSEEGDRKVIEAEDSLSSIANAFGFSKAKSKQIRIFKMFITRVQEETGIADPADALAAWIEEIY